MRSPALVVLLAVALVVPAGAAAQTYAGGQLDWERADRSSSYRSAGVALERSGDRVRVAFDSAVRCGRLVFFTEGRRTVALDGDSVRARGRGRVGARGADPRFRWSFSGRLSTDAGGGVLKVRARRGGRACRRLDIPVELRVAAGPPTGAPAAPAAGALFVGASDLAIRRRIRGTVVARIAPRGGRVFARWSMAARCDRGGPEVFTNFTPPTRIRPDGGFGRKERFTVRYSDVVVTYTVVFRGSFRADGVSGDLSLRALVRDRRSRRVLARCDSGTHSWTALPSAPAG